MSSVCCPLVCPALTTTMASPGVKDASISPPDAPIASPVVSALAARELPSAVNSKELLQEHEARTGGKVS